MRPKWYLWRQKIPELLRWRLNFDKGPLCRWVGFIFCGDIVRCPSGTSSMPTISSNRRVDFFRAEDFRTETDIRTLRFFVRIVSFWQEEHHNHKYCLYFTLLSNPWMIYRNRHRIWTELVRRGLSSVQWWEASKSSNIRDIRNQYLGFFSLFFAWCLLWSDNVIQCPKN